MSFPRYPSYKDSGVEWLGKVPEHWNKTALKFLGEYQNGFPFKPEDWGTEGLPIIRIAQLTGANEPNFYAGELDKRVRVATGDLLFSWSANIDSFIWERGPAWLNQHIFKVTPSVEADKKYLFYVIKHVAPKLADFDAHGSTMRHIKKESLGERVFVPPLAEQTAIADFLDQETGKIDELVAEQRRLMELLKEKRQAVISHAVTRGLNPAAPLKPSGIEWLGDVPAHWEVKKVKHLTRSIEQGWSPQCEGYPAETESEWGVLKVGCVNGGTFTPSENKVLPPELEPIPSLGIVSGDLLISRANTRELVGSAAVVGRDYPNLLLCDKLYRLRFIPDRCSPVFACRYLGSSAVRGQIELGATGASASMVNIPQSAILELAIAAPPFAEQHTITTFLDAELAKLDTLTAEAQRAIDLLQERRTALISAAVTGQIDVRGGD